MQNFKPAGLKARNLLLIGAGKKAQFEPARLREIAGAAVRSAKPSAGRRLLFCAAEIIRRDLLAV